MKTYRVSEVFVPGGLPQHTYVARKDRDLEEQIAEAKDNLCKIATVTGSTKSGKTVLVRRCFASQRHVWIDGGFLKTMDDFWRICAGKLSVIASQEQSSGSETSAEIAATFTAEANVVVAKGSGSVSPKKGKKRSIATKSSIAVHLPTQVEHAVRANKVPIIIDDFHYLKRDLQGEITRVVKPWVFDGAPVIYIAIPHRRFDAIKVEREMNGRVKVIGVPAWTTSELALIADKGLPLLNIKPDAIVSGQMADEAHGSPHLMQEFCKQACFKSGVRETAKDSREINPKYNFSQIYTEVASDLGKNIYDKLARGPRQRSDRMQRRLKSGQTADIYKVVLLALADLAPGVATVEYESLRSSIRDILDDDIPQAHEVSRVLEQMAKISSLDESSVPVIDYEKDDRRLHITDPFFAFFLKWGRELISAMTP